MAQGSTPRGGRLPDRAGALTVLPREPRTDPAPDWPLPGDPSPREASLWVQEWTRPQADIWRRDQLVNDVALYVRKRAEAEIPGSPSASVNALRVLSDDLLLTVGAQRRAGVVIGEPDEAPAALASVRSIGTSSSRSPRSSSRDRFPRVTSPAAS